MGFLERLFQEVSNLAKGGEGAVKPQKRFCPVDGTEMQVMRIKFSPTNVVEIDRCPKCGGIWFDKGELNKIIRIPLDKMKEIFGDLQEYKSIKGTSSGPRTCPVCGARLITYNYDFKSGIWLDACPKGHGIWLDKGELLLLKMYIETGQTFEAKEDAPKLKKLQKADRAARHEELEKEFMKALKELEKKDDLTTKPVMKKKEIPFKTEETPLKPKSEPSEHPKLPEKKPLIKTPTEKPTIKTEFSSPLAQKEPTPQSEEPKDEIKVEVVELGGFWNIRDILMLPDGKILILGDGGRVLVSEDGSNFTQVAELRENLTKGIVFGDKLVLASSYGSLFVGSVSDMSSFQRISLGYKTLNYLFQINNRLIILGGSGTLKITEDLSNFSDISVNTFSDLYAGVFAEGKVVIVGGSGLVLMGERIEELSKLDLGLTGALKSIRFLNGNFYITGTSGTLVKLSPQGEEEKSPVKVFGDFNDIIEVKGKLIIPGSSGKIFYGTFENLKEYKTNSFGSFYRAMEFKDTVLVVGDKATILKIYL